VIPSKIRDGLGISPGDFVDVVVNLQNKKIELRPYRPSGSTSIAGSLAKYARRKSFPTRKQAAHILRKGLIRES
jgi:AbrB family looped-hinge helix DNA binding protein